MVMVNALNETQFYKNKIYFLCKEGETLKSTAFDDFLKKIINNEDELYPI